MVDQKSLSRVAYAPSDSTSAKSGDIPKPNILFIKVDELRFPSMFPAGISRGKAAVPEFLAKYMPNTYALWQRGVKFANHYTAATACTPARGVLITGLYSQQSWLTQTIKAGPFTNVSISPELNRVYPTYGKLLRDAGYLTPYIGKWHVSIPPPEEKRLEAYGFDGLTYYDPTGANLQGTVGDHGNGFLNDADIADQAVDWLSIRSTSDQPWCLTVSFVNPHDHEFFWAGTEFETFNAAFSGQDLAPFSNYSNYKGQYYPPVVRWEENPLKSPPSYGYPEVPPNWEPAANIKASKPSTQTFARVFQGAVWGAVADDPAQTGIEISAYPNSTTLGIAAAPYSYWQRGLDSYTQAMTIVDQHIGSVVDALPREIAANTVIVFCSDHGDYAGAHGFVSGKVGSVYNEAYHVPLIVADGTGHFTGDIDIVREALTSSVDMMGLLVSLGNQGTRRWISGDLIEPYARRHDMIPMLRSSQAAGRPYVLLVDDEQVPKIYNFNGCPTHIIGIRTAESKFGVYANWVQGTTQINPANIELEFYDYSTERGRLEIDSTPGDSRVPALREALLTDILRNELRAPIAPAWRGAQHYSERAYLRYEALLNALTRRELSFGADF
jgi:arylsulfatase A-like enzyme